MILIDVIKIVVKRAFIITIVFVLLLTAVSCGTLNSAVDIQPTNDNGLLELSVVGVENTPEMGYAVEFTLDHSPGQLWQITGKQVELHVLKNGLWYKIDTIEGAGSDIGVWLNTTVWHVFRHPMTDSSGQILPSGYYRLSLDLSDELGLILTDEFDFEAPTGQTEDLSLGTHKELYPETWEMLRDIYGDYVCILDDGSFGWNVGKGNDQVVQMDTETQNYQGDELRLTYKGAIGREKFGCGFDFLLNNLTGRQLQITNEIPKLQIWLNGRWWTLQTMHDSSNAAMYWSIEEGDTALVKSAQAVYTQLQFPAGHYRYVISLEPEYEESLTVEFNFNGDWN